MKVKVIKPFVDMITKKVNEVDTVLNIGDARAAKLIRHDFVIALEEVKKAPEPKKEAPKEQSKEEAKAPAKKTSKRGSRKETKK